MKAFRSYQTNTAEEKGFALKFINGLSISVTFGGSNYCEHRNVPHGMAPTGGSDTAEILVSRGDENLFADGSAEFDEETGECICPQSDTGWKSANEVALIIALVAQMPGDIGSAECIAQIHKALDDYVESTG